MRGSTTWSRVVFHIEICCDALKFMRLTPPGAQRCGPVCWWPRVTDQCVSFRPTTAAMMRRISATLRTEADSMPVAIA